MHAGHGSPSRAHVAVYSRVTRTPHGHAAAGRGQGQGPTFSIKMRATGHSVLFLLFTYSLDACCASKRTALPTHGQWNCTRVSFAQHTHVPAPINALQAYDMHALHERLVNVMLLVACFMLASARNPEVERRFTVHMLVAPT